MISDPADLAATDAVARMRSGQLTVECFARACLDRIAARDGEIRAWTFVDPDLVLAQARALDATGPVGPLHGLPVGIKDVILTRDMPTQHNSPLYKGAHPEVDAACVSLLRSAGALIFGKTDTVEFAATGRRAQTRNPHDPSRTPGGSSSGSAAAVADFHVPMTLGTQTGGSTIRPASFCGVPAMKPTWSLVSREGAKTYAPSLDTIGWFGRTVADLAMLYDVFDPYAEPVAPFRVAGARIGLCRTPIWDRADPASQAALTAGAARLRAAGAQVIDLDLPPTFDDLPAQQRLIMRAEGAAAFLPEYRAFPGRLEASLSEQVENIDRYTRADLVAAYDQAALRRIDFDRIAGGFDAVLTLSAVGEATEGLQGVGDMAFNGLWTLLQTPCVNVPGFTGPHGLPIGLTVTGPRFQDRRVLAAAAAFAPLFAA